MLKTRASILESSVCWENRTHYEQKCICSCFWILHSAVYFPDFSFKGDKSLQKKFLCPKMGRAWLITWSQFFALNWMMLMASNWDSWPDSFKTETNLGQVRRVYGAMNQIAILSKYGQPTWVLLVFDWLINSKFEFSKWSDVQWEWEDRSDVRIFFRRSKDRRRSMFLQIFRKILDAFSPCLEWVWLWVLLRVKLKKIRLKNLKEYMQSRRQSRDGSLSDTKSKYCPDTNLISVVCIKSYIIVIVTAKKVKGKEMSPHYSQLTC